MLVEKNLAFPTKEDDPYFSRLMALVIRYESQGSSLRETSRQGNRACLNDAILLILFLFAWHRGYGPKPSFVFGQYPSLAFAGVNVIICLGTVRSFVCGHPAYNCPTKLTDESLGLKVNERFSHSRVSRKRLSQTRQLMSLQSVSEWNNISCGRSK